MPLFQNASFLTTVANLRDLPADAVYEVAFAGRSNAGKSSAINALTRQKALARTSKTPGRTQSINLFTLGRAAIYPAGSWEIAGFNTQATFKMGAFPPPVAAAGDTCYISDHTDIAIGMNAKSPNAEAAKTFLQGLSTLRPTQIRALAEAPLPQPGG